MRNIEKKSGIAMGVLFGTIVLVMAFLLVPGIARHQTTLDPADYYSRNHPYVATSPGHELNLSGEGYQPLAQNERFILEINGEDGTFRIVNKDTGTIWNGGRIIREGETVIPRNRRIMQALLSVTYLESSDSVQTLSISNSAQNVVTTYREIPDGIEFTYRFEEEMGISVSLQIGLDDTGFYALIPDGGVKEEGEGRVVSIDILPAFGSMMSQSDGYYVYPDGSGTLYDVSRSYGNGELFTANVYGDRSLDLENYEIEKKNGIKQIALPYFGYKEEGQGAVAYIVSGAETARISLSEGAQLFALNRQYATRVYRQMLHQQTQQGEREVYAKSLELGDFCVKYILLEGDEATYSGMANALRHFLQSIEVLPQSSDQLDSIPVVLDILLGTKESSLLGETDLTMTTYRQAKKALESLQSEGVNSYHAYLLGWQKGGYGQHPLTLKPSSSNGSKVDFSSLLSLDDGKQKRVLLQTDYMYAQEGGSFSRQADIVFNFLKKAASNQNNTLFLLNPHHQLKKFKQDLSVYGKWGASSLAFDSLSDWLPSDSTQSRRTSCEEAANFYASMVMLNSNQGNYTAVQGGNAYLLRHTDSVYNLCESDSQWLIFTKQIPFMQMVLHGIIPYSGETPGNMASSYEELRLKWVEYGAMPYFIITEKKTSALKNSKIKDVFSSEFKEWQAEIIRVHKEFNKNLARLFSQTIHSHEYLTDELVRIEYERGDAVLVNYQKTAARWGEVTIPAQGYAVLEKDGQVTSYG